MLTYKTKKHILKTETVEGVETLGASSAAVSTTETVAAGDKLELFATPARRFTTVSFLLTFSGRICYTFYEPKLGSP